jgi:uncharacterized protein YjbI with pentapeptide repeats
MADEQQLALLRESVREWNLWRKDNPDATIDLSKADLREADLWEANLREAHLTEADLSHAQLYRADLHGAHLHRARLYRAYLSGADLGGADLSEANLRKANLITAQVSGANLIAADLSGVDLREADLKGTYLSGARLYHADLSDADLHEAILNEADLSGANLSRADLSGADVSDANLSEAICIGTDFAQATLTGCRVYGSTSWDVHLEGATQEDLCITPLDQPAIMVDHLAVAQFIYLMLNNQPLRQVIDTITSKVVLIVGCFPLERKVVLDALREELRQQGYLPVAFDFAVPAPHDLTETVSTLARMARFVMVDLTDAQNLPQELASVIPNLPSVTVQPLIEEGSAGHAWLEQWRQLSRVLDLYAYPDLDGLVASLKERVIDPAERRANEFAPQTKTIPLA